MIKEEKATPNSSSSRLGVNKPIGTHGDVVLELQVRYANNDEIRQRVVHQHTTKRSTREEKNKFVEKKVSSFLASARIAANSGDPKLARNAIENLAQVEQQNSHFSMVGDYAEVALLRLQSSSSSSSTQFSIQDAEREIQRRKHRRFYKVCLVTVFIISFFLILFLDDEGAHPIVFSVLIILMIGCCTRTCQQREQYAKQLVDELFEIATLDCERDRKTEEGDTDDCELQMAPLILPGVDESRD